MILPLSETQSVKVISAAEVHSFEDFKALQQRELGSDCVPCILRNAPQHQAEKFSVQALEEACGEISLPELSSRGGFLVADQGDSDVMEADPSKWTSVGHSFKDLTRAIRSGSPYYLSMRTENRSCRREGNQVLYDPTKCSDGSNVVLKAIMPKAPVPELLPCGVDFVTIIWIGSKGRNFGLHSDLFTEQFVLQNEGVKEALLLLPRDASAIQPFSFLESEKFYKSSLRSCARLQKAAIAGEILRAELQPGDILYIPPMWWHEFVTISDGPSLTTTFRIHLPENKQFYNALDNIYKLYTGAMEHGRERLAAHIATFFGHACTATLPLRPAAKERSKLALVYCAVAVAVSSFALGLVCGRRF